LASNCFVNFAKIEGNFQFSLENYSKTQSSVWDEKRLAKLCSVLCVQSKARRNGYPWFLFTKRKQAREAGREIEGEINLKDMMY